MDDHNVQSGCPYYKQFDDILNYHSIKGSKAVCTMSQICGMLKNPVITWKLGHRQNLSAISRPISSLANRCLDAQDYNQNPAL
jgi:hypothetical protein